MAPTSNYCTYNSGVYTIEHGSQPSAAGIIGENFMSGGVLSRWLFACAGLLSAPWALGQNVTAATSFYTPGAYTQMPYYGYGGFGGGGYGWGGFNGIGSTPQGSYLGGMSQVIRSQGQYNLMSSQAAVNLQEAQKKNIENQVQWTNAYIEMRRMRDAYRAETKVPPPTAEAWARNAHAAAPDRLPSSSLDPVTGALQWPGCCKARISRRNASRSMS